MDNDALYYFNLYAPFIEKTASKYPLNMREDLIQESYLAIEHAMSKNNHEEYLPAPYLMTWIRSFMQDYYYKNHKSVNYSRSSKDKVKGESEFCENYDPKDIELKHSPDPSDILEGYEKMLEMIDENKKRKSQRKKASESGQE